MKVEKLLNKIDFSWLDDPASRPLTANETRLLQKEWIKKAGDTLERQDQLGAKSKHPIR